MDPISIATLVLGSASEVIKLASAAIEAARAGNEDEAYALLEKAEAKAEKMVLGLTDALKAVRERVAKYIRDKFHGGVQP
jgi:beta-galactosidase GanA